MIYFDNAATGGFKPYSVITATETTLKFLSANPGRSAHRLASAGAEIVYNCRKVLADNFGATAEKCIFTKNCTEALNTAIFGSLKIGGHVITSTYEHNSVLRPLIYLKNQGLISLDIVEKTDDLDIIRAIKEKINDKTYLIVLSAVSNVTGEKLPYNEVADLAFEKNILFLLDGAQAGGHIRIDVNKEHVSFLALACHKGLFAPMGSGALILNDTASISPLTHGGTGSESLNLSQPQCYPERLESGTLNLPAIAGLAEGARYAFDNLDSFAKTLTKYTSRLIEELSKIETISLYSAPNPFGIVSFNLPKISSSDVADILNQEYDIAVRSGFHCAPLIHKSLNTLESGVVRASLSVNNTISEIIYFVRCVKKIADG